MKEKAAYKKNDRVTVTIEDMGMDGEGIGKADGYTLFIKDAVIGDLVEGVKAFSFSCKASLRLCKGMRRLSAPGSVL